LSGSGGQGIGGTAGSGGGAPQLECYGAELCNPTGDSIGGGNGYSRVIDSSSAKCTATDRATLLSCLQTATAGQVVYVDDGATIDLAGAYQVSIHAGVILASGRGRGGSSGGLIRNSQLPSSSGQVPMFAAGGGVRITGLRLHGPWETRAAASVDCSAVEVRNADSLEVDNCEIWGWPYAGIDLTDSEGARIHHNFIHHNQAGTGYGIVIAGRNGASAVIEANRFNWNRHDIAASGWTGQGYEARYNVVEEHDEYPGGHSFDMHGGYDRNDGTQIAGDWMKIHHNTFLYTTGRGVAIRGVPDQAAYVHHNIFRQTGITDAVAQLHKVGNLFVYCNEVGAQSAKQTYSLIQCIGTGCPSGTPSAAPTGDSYFTQTDTCH
jgi:hypothetical protein